MITLRCVARPTPVQAECAGGRVTVDGVMELQAVYMPVGGADVQAATLESPFTVSFQTDLPSDAPLLLESGMDAVCDKVLVVLAPAEERLRRLLLRDGITEEEVRRRMSVQQTDDFYAEKADAVLCNDGDLAALARQLRAVLSRWEAGEL